MKNTKIFLIFSFILVSFAAPAQSVYWDLNDVTYIMPLPENLKNNLLLTSDKGLGGALIPKPVIVNLPTLSMNHTDEEIIRDTRLMAVRIDPCFPLPTPQSCQKQIRMVWQPLEMGLNQKMSTVDVALHSFYVLQDSEFTSLLKDLQRWKAKYQTLSEIKNQALDIHPFWKKEKDQSGALIEFNQILKNYVGEKNLSRVTAMVLRRVGDVWGFLGMGIDSSGAWKPLAIPRVGEAAAQLFFNELNSEKEFLNSAMNPAPSTPDMNLSLFIETSQALSEKELITNLRSAFDIENPEKVNPENMDCVNCHIAQPSREWILNQLKPDLRELEKKQFSYKNEKYNLENRSAQVFNAQQTRAVGYFKDQLAISQRVINESAAVADLLNAL